MRVCRCGAIFGTPQPLSPRLRYTTRRLRPDPRLLRPDHPLPPRPQRRPSTQPSTTHDPRHPLPSPRPHDRLHQPPHPRRQSRREAGASSATSPATSTGLKGANIGVAAHPGTLPPRRSRSHRTATRERRGRHGSATGAQTPPLRRRLPRPRGGRRHDLNRSHLTEEQGTDPGPGDKLSDRPRAYAQACPGWEMYPTGTDRAAFRLQLEQIPRRRPCFRVVIFPMTQREAGT
jgi:hypothetical protein